MKYQNAKSILPLSLLKEIQEYIDEGVIYIPRKEKKRKAWGSNSNTRILLAERNKMIISDYASGIPVHELSKKYFLATSTIRKIVYGESK